MKIIYQDTFREIKKGAGRFVSLFLIVALGVAFYAGIRSCSPDMILSADNLYDSSDLMDLRVISTAGITDDDINDISSVEGVGYVKGIHAQDFLCRLGDTRDAVKVRSYTEDIDKITLQQGRTIENKSECLMDSYFFDFYNYELGDSIELLESSEGDISDTVDTTVFTIVGCFTSPEYLSFDLGSTQMGSGKLNGLIMVSEDVFVTDYYSFADISVSGAKEEMSYSGKYDSLTDSVSDRLDEIKASCEDRRFDEIRGEYQSSLDDARNELTDKEQEFNDAEKEIADNETVLNALKAEADLEASMFGYESAFSHELLSQVEDGYEQLNDAKAELEDARSELEDARQKISDSEKGIEELKKPEWYILDRKYLTEYSSFRSDADRIGNVGKVFPVIFFIVAALVCLTAMTRMVDEERTQIGTLKALGYSKAMIMRKYIVYALIATVSGSVVGALTGSKILPYVILNVYKLMYPNIPELLYPYNAEHCLVASFAALGCILAATFFACTRSLLENPADLMRPVSPKPGRKLLLERIKPLWHKIPFTWKNAFRNFVRYKKRLFMTLFGIIGSTALLLVGFGLKDAVNTILYTQFGDIHKYDEVITTSSSDDGSYEKLIEHINADDRFAFYRFAHESAVDVESEKAKEPLGSYIFVPQYPEKLDDMIELRDRLSQRHLPLDDEKVIISEKMSRTLNVRPGDQLTLSADNKDRKTVTVGSVTENYVYHYVYMTPTLYRELYGHEPEYNQIVITNNEGVNISETEFGDEYMEEASVAGVMCIDAMKDKFADKLKSMDSITLVLIICAGALTFVVLYNLNNINISERRRELATLKVLGFYDIELSGYIYRENILITIIGIGVGVFAGFFLNRFVVTTVEVDIVMFGRQILLSSYLLSILIAAGFTAIVNLIIHYKMKNIDMAASLKSVE